MEDSLCIVHIADYLMPQLGYQECFLPKWNQRHGHTVHIITSDRYRPIPSYEQTWGTLLGPRIRSPGVSMIEGVHVHRLAVAFEVKSRPWLLKMEETISRIDPDVVFVHGTGSLMAFHAARVARRLRLPMLMDNHMVFSSRNRRLHGKIYYRVLRLLSPRWLGRTAHKFLGVANECCEFLAKEQGIDPQAIECLPLAVDTDLFQPDDETRATMRRRFGLPETALVILQTGKLVPRKAPQLLSEAVAPLLKRDPQLHLVFVGGGDEEYLARVRTPPESLGVGAQVHFIPLVPVAELAAMYSMADVVVYPAGTSLSCLEASACELPVIMTDLPASRWREEHGVGMCFKDGDAEDLRRTIEQLIHDKPLRREMGRRGRAAVVQHFSYDTVAWQSEELMREAIVAHGNSREVTSRFPIGLVFGPHTMEREHIE